MKLSKFSFRRRLLFAVFSLIPLGSNAQSISFAQLLGVYKGILTPDNAFSSAQKFEVKGLGLQGSAPSVFYVINKGLPVEETIAEGKDIQTDQASSRKTLSYFTKDSVAVSQLQSQVLAAQFKLDSHQELLGMKTYNYSQDSVVVWFNQDGERNFTIKLMHK